LSNKRFTIFTFFQRPLNDAIETYPILFFLIWWEAGKKLAHRHVKFLLQKRFQTSSLSWDNLLIDCFFFWKYLNQKFSGNKRKKKGEEGQIVMIPD
jgi:hypothetical protein